MSNDILYNCALAYKQLLNYEYTIKLQTNKAIKDITITFNETEFKHLLGIHKLIDLPLYANMASSTFFNNVLAGKICYADISSSLFFNSPLNHHSSGNIDYYIADRILELTKLQNYIKNLGTDCRGIFKWEKNTASNQRPYQSDISADVLIVFSKTNSKTTADELMCSFFIESISSGKYDAVSIFPTDVSYSDDGRIKLPEYQILSADEICKSTGVVTHLIECSSEELQKAEISALKKDQSITISNDLKALKSKRKAFIKAPENQSAEAAYKKKLAIFKNPNIYTENMLNEVMERLLSQAKDNHNIDSAPYIKGEIQYIYKELRRRQQKSVSEKAMKNFSIVWDQPNNDGTISKKTVAEIAVPKVIDDIHNKVERDSHTIIGSIKSLFYDIAEKIKNRHHIDKSDNEISVQDVSDNEIPKPSKDYSKSFEIKFPAPDAEQEIDTTFQKHELKISHLDILIMKANKERMRIEKEKALEKENHVEKSRNDFSDISR